MSETTNLKLFKHDNPETNENQFDVEKALNENWDKIDGEAGKVDTKLSKLEIEKAELQEENERLREDIKSLPKGNFLGENIDLNDSAEMRLQSLEIQGNSRQETTTQSNNIFDPKKAIVREISNWWSTVISNITDNTSVTIDEGNFLHGTSSTYLVVVVPFKFKKNKTIYNKTPKLGNSLMIYNETGHNICEQGVNLSDNYTPTETFEGYLGVRIEKTINVDDTYVFFSYDENAEFEKFTPDSPSPDYPSEVESCGDNVNLFDKDNAIILNAYVENTNNKIINSNTERIIICECKANTTYTISKNVKTNLNRFRIDCANKRPVLEDTVTKLFYNNEVNNATITTTEDAKYLILQMHSEASAETVTREEVLNSIKIEVGSTPTPYSKFEQGNISFEMCNKNRFDKNNTRTGFYYTIAGQIGTSLNWNISNIKTKPNQKYSISGNTVNNTTAGFVELDNDLKIIKVIGAYKNTSNFTTSENCAYIGISVPSYIDGQGDDLDSFQIEEGETTDYEEHKSQTYTIPTQKSFRKIDTYKDTFIRKNGKRYERHFIYRRIFNGTEDWSYNSSIKVFLYNDTSSPIAKSFMNLDVPQPVCASHYTIVSWNSYSNKNNNASVLSYVWVYTAYRIRDDRFTTVEEFKVWLQQQYNAGTPVYFDYILSEPEDIECTAEQTEILDKIENEAKTYKGVTHIYSTDKISPIFEGTYNKDIETMINNISKEVIANV